MKTLDQIRAQLASGRYELSRHAFHRIVERNIRSDEIAEAGSGADLIEEYPNDKYSPSGLLLGFTADGRPLHIQVSFADTEKVKIITIYQPDEDEWIEYRIRQ